MCEVHTIHIYVIYTHSYMYVTRRYKDFIMIHSLVLNIVGGNRLNIVYNRYFQDLFSVMILIPLMSFRPVGYTGLYHRIYLKRSLRT